MYKKTIYYCSALALVSFVITVPAYASMTADRIPIAHQWPALNGWTAEVTTYTDPNSPGGGGPIRTQENFDGGRGLMQTFTVGPAQFAPIDGNGGFTLKAIAFTEGGGDGSATNEFSVHIFDLRTSVGPDAGGFVVSTDSIPPRYDWLSTDCKFIFWPDDNEPPNDYFVILNFTLYDSFDLETNHLYDFEIWGPYAYPAGMDWLRDASDSHYPGGRAYECPGDADGPDPGTGPADLSATRGQISGGSRDLTLAVYGIIADGNAYHPQPRNYETDVSITSTLSWHSGEWVAGTQGHQLWFGTSGTAVRNRNSSANKGRLDANSFNPGTLAFNTTYYWKVDEYNSAASPPCHPDGNCYWGTGTSAAENWRFTTINPIAKNPVPATGTGARFTLADAQLSWTKGYYAADVNGHQVYFGADSTQVTNATTSTAVVYRGQVTDPCYLLKNLAPDYTPFVNGTTYYWRVDEVNSTMPPYAWKGATWNFTYYDEPPVWGASGKIFLNGPPGAFDEISVKDPTIVYSGGKWHLFYTGRDWNMWRMGYACAPTIAGLKDAEHIFMSSLNGGSYFAAPQVFWFEPQSKWYLIYQSGLGPTFSTNTDINDPNGWAAGASMGFADANDGNALDFWCVSDGNSVYVFYSRLNGSIYRRSTTVADFPYNWSAADAVCNSWEGIHVYKNIADGKYYMMVEEVFRYFELWTATSLGGTWTQVEEYWATADNIAETKEHWTIQVSHGEIIRAGTNERCEISDINNCEILFQGMLPGGEGGPGGYAGIFYRLGMLWKCAAGRGDIDHDCDVDLMDFAVVGSQWQQWPGVPSADVEPPEGDSIVDENDLGLLADSWLWGMEQILTYTTSE